MKCMKCDNEFTCNDDCLSLGTHSDLDCVCPDCQIEQYETLVCYDNFILCFKDHVDMEKYRKLMVVNGL